MFIWDNVHEIIVIPFVCACNVHACVCVCACVCVSQGDVSLNKLIRWRWRVTLCSLNNPGTLSQPLWTHTTGKYATQGALQNYRPLETVLQCMYTPYHETRGEDPLLHLGDELTCCQKYGRQGSGKKGNPFQRSPGIDWSACVAVECSQHWSLPGGTAMGVKSLCSSTLTLYQPMTHTRAPISL